MASETNPLWKTGILSSTSHCLEMGCGVSPLLSILVGLKVSRFVATDQRYALRQFKRNLQESLCDQQGARQQTMSKDHGRGKPSKASSSSKIEVVELDWEESCIEQLPRILQQGNSDDGLSWDGPDVVVACDCVINEALTAPFVQACASLCSLRRSRGARRLEAAVCIVAQQLRSPDVLNLWLARMTQQFHVYRVRDDQLPTALGPHSGHVVHLATLKNL